MKKKVCHITSAHSRYDVRIFIKECATLAKNGYDVTLIVNDNKTDEINNGVKIVSTKFKPKNRLERFFISKKLLLAKALEVDADIYHLHDPDLLPLGNKLRRKGKKVIFDSHENIPLQIMDKGYIPKVFRKSISQLYRKYEMDVIRNYNAVIGATPSVTKRFKEINANSETITNYPIVSEEMNKAMPSRTICYAGGISPQWNHDKIINAIEEIGHVKYILAGNSTKKYMKMLKELKGWDKVDYRGKIPYEQVKKIYSESLAGMAINYSSQTRDEGNLSNTKLFEYMENGLAVICSNFILWKEIVNKYNCGICVDPNNTDEIREAIEYLINNPQKAIQMGQNGRKAVLEKYNWESQAEVLLELYRNI